MLRNQVSSVSSLLENEFMPRSTVAEFAYELRKTPETLFGQLKSAGAPKTAASDLASEPDKQSLLDYLKASHDTAADGGRKKITLVKKSTIEIKQADSTRRVRTIQVVARNKRTFVQCDESCPTASASMQPQDESELIRRRMIDGGSLAGNALVHHQIVRRNGVVTPFECNRIAAAMAKAFHDVYSAGLGGMVPESHSIVPFKWVTSWHFPVTEGRRMCGCMGKRRRLNGAMSQGFFSPEKSNLRNAP